MESIEYLLKYLLREYSAGWPHAGARQELYYASPFGDVRIHRVASPTSEGMRLPGRYSVVEHPADHVSGSIRQATLLQGDNLGLQQKQLQQTHYQTSADTGISGALRSKL